MQGITETLKKDSTSKMKGASAGLNKNAMWSVDVAILSAFDFVYNPQTEQFMFSCGSVVIGGTFTFNKTMYTIVYGVPLFLNFSATLQGNATIAYTTQEGKDALSAGDFDSYAGNLAQRLQAPQSSLTLMLSGKVQAGVGMCGVVSARGYVSLGIQFDIPLEEGKQGGALLSGSGGIGIDMLLLTFNFDIAKFFTGFGSLKNQQKFDFFGGLMSADVGSKSAGTQAKTASKGQVLRESEEGEQLVMHEYTPGTSDMGSFGKYNSRRATLEPVAVHTLLDNAAERTRPRILPLDGDKKFMVFIGSRSGEPLNSAALYYSVYDGMEWSVPKIVSDDGTVDAAPDLLRAGDKVVLAWPDAEREFTQADQPKDKLSALEISVAVYDIKSGTMGQEITLTDDGWMDFAPQLVVDGTKIYCSYMKRDLTNVTKNEDLIDFTGIYSTMAYQTYDFGAANSQGGQKGKEQYIEVGHETLDDPLVMDWHSALAEVDGRTYLVSTYTIDEDLNFNTNEDRELYLDIYDIDSNRRYYPIRISRDRINQSNPKLTDIGGTLYLTWLESGYQFHIMDVSQLLTALFDTSTSILTTGEGSVAIDKEKYRSSDEKDAGWYQKSAQELGMDAEFYENSIYADLADNRFPSDAANFSQDSNLMTSIASYVLTSDGDDLYVFYTDFGEDADATGVEIYGVRYERHTGAAQAGTDGEWGFSKAVQLTNSNKVIDELDLYMEKDGSVSAVSNYFDQWIDEAGKIQYGPNQLVEIDFETKNSVEVKNGLIVFPSKITAGSTSQLSFEAVNNGLLTAEGFDYTVSQSSGGSGTIIQKGHVDVPLKAGQSETVTVPWKVPKDVSNTSIQVSVVETGVQGQAASSAVSQVPCESQLHFLESQVLWKEKQPYVEAVVENAGAVGAKAAKGVLSLVDDNNKETKTYAEFKIPALASGKEKTIQIPFTPGMDDFNWLGCINLKLEAFGSSGSSIAETYTKLTASGPVCAQINGGEANITLARGKKAALQAKAAPWGTLAGSVRYYSTDESVASVNGKGTVTGIGAGEADIYAYYGQSGLSTSIHVTVSGAPAKRIVPAQKQVLLPAGKQKSVAFTAQGLSQVTVSVTGNPKVSAKAKGSQVVISADKKAAKGSKAAVTLTSKDAAGKTVKATVAVSIQNKAVKITPVKKQVAIEKGGTATCVLKVTAQNPKKAVADTVTVSSDYVSLKKYVFKKGSIELTLKGKKAGSGKAQVRVGSKTCKVNVLVKASL